MWNSDSQNKRSTGKIKVSGSKLNILPNPGTGATQGRCQRLCLVLRIPLQAGERISMTVTSVSGTYVGSNSWSVLKFFLWFTYTVPHAGCTLDPAIQLRQIARKDSRLSHFAITIRFLLRKPVWNAAHKLKNNLLLKVAAKLEENPHAFSLFLLLLYTLGEASNRPDQENNQSEPII